jgi:hypothetical protein
MAEDENEFISVVQAVKLIPRNFDGNPKQLREFCEAVESARQVVHPTKHPLLLKFIESKITGDAKDRLLARSERNTWAQIKSILEENYSVKRTLEYYASLLFTSKQGYSETVAQWGSRIDNMGLDLMRGTKTRIENVNPNAVEGGVILVSEFMKGTFVAGLKDDWIKYIVKARGEEDSLAKLVETALQEESEVKSQKFKGNNGNLTWPNAGYAGNFYAFDNCLILLARVVWCTLVFTDVPVMLLSLLSARLRIYYYYYVIHVTDAEQLPSNGRVCRALPSADLAILALGRHST